MFKTSLSEAKFTSIFLRNFKANGGWGFKIPDIGRTIKPFDWFGINEEGVHFCEVKAIENGVFRFSQLRNNQYTALKRIWLASKKYKIDSIKTYILLYDKVTGETYKMSIANLILEEKSGNNKMDFKKVLKKTLT